MLCVVFRRKIIDEYNDEEVELTKEEIKLIRRMMESKAPHADFDPFPVSNILNLIIKLIGHMLLSLIEEPDCSFFSMQSYIDWFDWDGAKHPLSNAPEPKRRFIPSKWEAKKVCCCVLVTFIQHKT